MKNREPTHIDLLKVLWTHRCEAPKKGVSEDDALPRATRRKVRPKSGAVGGETIGLGFTNGAAGLGDVTEVLWRLVE